MEISPYASVGAIKFGATQAEVRSIIIEQPKYHQRSFEDISDRYDAFNRLGIHVFYDAEGKVIAIEFFDAPGPMFLGRDLLSFDYQGLLSYLKLHDPDLHVLDDDTIQSKSLGLAASPRFVGEDEAVQVCSVIVCCRGYWGDE